DGRYTLQASAQIEKDIYEIHDIAKKRPIEWLKENARSGMKIGFDPRLHSYEEIDRWRKALSKNGIELLSEENNPVDKIWADRPASPMAPVRLRDLKFSGKSSAEKRQSIANDLQASGIAAAVIIDPASIAWLLNVRGNDVPNTPIALSSGIICDDSKFIWFIDSRKTNDELTHRLGDQVIYRAPSEFPAALRELGANKTHVRIDESETSYYIVETLKQAGAILDCGVDPCALPKAIKNPVEIDGMRTAHKRDGVALCGFLSWLDNQPRLSDISELTVVDKLESFRSEQDLYCGPSFDTIAGAGKNGAMIHYEPTRETNRALDENSFLLLDSGGQYEDGTTDVTRTIATGSIDEEKKDRFTRVLKGCIALSNIRFPEGTTGAELDVLARQYLWEIGQDYNHGTGHGVGSYLCVHEGPQAISRRNDIALKPGMVLSNEPGYYKENAYGIRTENLQLVIDMPEISEKSRKMLGFETLTLAPIDTRAIAIDMLTTPEKEWLNQYHAKIRETLRPLISDERVLTWLTNATKPIDS
ncbi:MAG: aminopeptidase family protein P, partial [Alphaproteobacteria bacterium]|nr:aminopeptidase family protein P [Alphaproteobacteria bacterium]